MCWHTIISEDIAASIFSIRSEQHGPLKHWCPATSLRVITTQKTMTKIYRLFKIMITLLSNGYQRLFPGGKAVKRPGHEADHSPPASAEVKNAWSCTYTSQYAFMAWCPFKAQGKLYLYLYLFYSGSARTLQVTSPLPPIAASLVDLCADKLTYEYTLQFG
jgi:hypothetical protein